MNEEDPRMQKLREAVAKAQAEEKAEMQKKSILKSILTPGAYERAMNVRMANPELYDQVINLLVYLYQQKKLGGKVDDSKFYRLLSQIASNRREGSISVKRK